MELKPLTMLLFGWWTLCRTGLAATVGNNWVLETAASEPFMARSLQNHVFGAGSSNGAVRYGFSSRNACLPMTTKGWIGGSCPFGIQMTTPNSVRRQRNGWQDPS